MKTLVFLSLLLPLVARASGVLSRVRLYEIAKDRYTLVPGALRPNRVYAVFDEKSKKWLLRITDAQPALPEETLVAGTVLAGNYMGGDSADRYLLTETGEWIPTKKKQEHRFRIENGLASFRIFIPR